ncbi:MAG: DNA polymerase Y family protein, partial [Burkholderiales bacterium]|nr:DNA polymerase Y family protein [Burkholderiales bacterium]
DVYKRQAPDVRPGQRPFWLLPEPRPLAEIDAVPHHGGPLTLLAGPERIESGWWDGAPCTRDYFVARTRADALVWVYREHRGGWFLHGVFA